VLVVGIAAFLGLLAAFAMVDVEALSSAPTSAGSYIFWACVTVDSWCWCVVMLYVGMRFLNFSNQWMRYGQEAILPFYVLHQPVIFAIAFYVVQWQASVTIKMLAVVAAFVVSIGLYELIIRRLGGLRVIFGVKAGQPDKTQVSTG